MDKAEICREIYSAFTEDQELVQKLTNMSVIKKYRRKEYIVHTGEVQQYLYFLVDGVVRGFFDKSDNQEVTDCIIYKKGTPFFASTAMHRVEPATQMLQAITPAVLIAFPVRFLNEILEEYPVLKDYYIRMLTESLEMHMGMKVARSLKDIGRCEWLLVNHPDLVGRIQKQYLASYLDMTLSSYGRAMKKIQERIEASGDTVDTPETKTAENPANEFVD